MDLLHTAHVPAGPGPFPTVVLLHGLGANAHDLFGFAPALSRGRALILAPQAPIEMPFGGGHTGYAWFPFAESLKVDPVEFKRSADLLRSFLDQAEQVFPIDRRRLVLAGFSQGGVMAYDLALRDPGRFAGLAALSSWLPGILAETVAPNPGHAKLPVLVLHGTRDTLLDVERGRESREELRKLGVAMTYRELEMGHEIRPEAFRLLLRWLDDKAFAGVEERS